MSPYPVLCTSGCGRPAIYKIAAPWNDGVTTELKTYALTCDECLEVAFAQSLTKQAACRLTTNESLGVPYIYELQRGERDRELTRRPELECAHRA